MGAAPPGHRGGLPVLEQRPRPRLSPEGGHPGRPRDGRDGPGDGLRQPRRDLRDRRPVHARTRRPASRRSTATCCSTPRARTSSPARIGPSRSRSSTSACPTSPPSCASMRTRLERHYADLCDIEFTIEEGRLWMLQVRVGKRSPAGGVADRASTWPRTRRSPSRARSRSSESPPCSPIRRRPPARGAASCCRSSTGLPASPGMASGPIVTNPEAAQVAAEAGQAAILVRAETSPDDVHGMARAAGILTSLGGMASHAAVVARGWGIPAVVGASGIEVSDGQVVVGERVLRSGDVITIDGSTGEVFEGTIPGTTEIVPEARTLLAWARELGVTIGEQPSQRRRRRANPSRIARPPPTTACASWRSRA